MAGSRVFAELVRLCRERGSEIEAAEFASACHRLARTLHPDLDDGEEAHLELLLDKGDRLAAAMLLLPYPWGFRLERSSEGLVHASVDLPQRGPQEEVTSDDEGAAMLGAIAATLGSMTAAPPLR